MSLQKLMARIADTVANMLVLSTSKNVCANGLPKSLTPNNRADSYDPPSFDPATTVDYSKVKSIVFAIWPYLSPGMLSD